ncbi:MAG: hypothetical protein ACRDKI_10555 [Solirubrobacterales bacterium]
MSSRRGPWPVIAAIAIVGSVLISQHGAGAAPGGLPRVEPVVGEATTVKAENAQGAVALLGAAGKGEPGEAWAFQKVLASTPPPVVNGTAVQFGTRAGVYAQPVFLRHTDATGWQMYETPAAADGTTLSNFTPVYSSASVAPNGGGVLIGAANDTTPVALIRRPGGRYTITQPPSPVLLPAERLADGNRAPAVAFDTAGGKAAAFATATGSTTERVLYYDGASWSRDDVQLPDPSRPKFKVLAIDATGATNAWLIAQLDDSLGRGVALFQRSAGVWRERSLGSSVFAEAATPAASVEDLKPLEQSTQAPIGFDPLTVTTDGVWIDGQFEVAGARDDFTAYYDIDAARVTGSWCDPLGVTAICDRPLGARFSRQTGYRSTAWAGGGFGERVISNPLAADGANTSNRGTYLALRGSSFVRMPGAGDADKATTALSSPTSGWLSVNARLTDATAPHKVAGWSVGARAPFNSIAPEPGRPVGSLDSGALAVGDNGGVARYQPGVGWVTEFLLSSTGLVRRPTLRAVAWPESGRAHAVGDSGEMWLWRSETGQWERDPGAPVGFNTQMNDIAFNPASPSDGYAVGRDGTILHYGKSWTRVCLHVTDPGDCDGEQAFPNNTDPKILNADFREIAYSGGEPIVISKDRVLELRNGSWQFDADAEALIAKYAAKGNGIQLLTVSGLPDGGAFIGGVSGFALIRDSLNAPWKTLDQPLSSLATTASALFRENGKLRALVSVTKEREYTPLPIEPLPSPNSPPPLHKPLVPPAEGFLLRQTADGWRDEQRDAYMSNAESDLDRPAKSAPIQAILASATGDAWLAGGQNGLRDTTLAGYAEAGDSAQRTRIQTAFIGRYSSSGGAPPSGQGAPTPVPQSATTINFVVGGNASCENVACDDFRNGDIAPDRQLSAALEKTATMQQQIGGPRFFMYTGGRRPDDSASPESAAAANRFAELLAGQPSLPTLAATAPGDTTGGDAGAYRAAFANFPKPFGGAPAAPGIDPRPDPATPGGHTHYAFESNGANGPLRVIVIDNSRGSLAASDPYQNPPVASQRAWLIDQLKQAKDDGVPAIVVGNRDLHSTFAPKLNRAGDAQDTAKVLRDYGASAYFFDRPEENRMYPIPAAGEPDPIPSFGSGTLGYRSEVENVGAADMPSSFFGNTGMLLAQVDASKRDPKTNRAPVAVRMIPLIESLNLEAIDGTLLRRSRPALFSGLGKRPDAGDRWGPGQTPSPAGSDPYTIFPSPVCKLPACDTRIAPEYQFHSSDPDIADFVAVDPQSSNLRKPLLNGAGKPVADASSGLLCPYNSGTTTLSITAGGITYSRKVTVQPGSVRPPCGTVPLNPSRFAGPQPGLDSPPPPPPAPVSPVIALVPPPLPTPSKPKPNPPAIDEFVPMIEPVFTVPVVPPPPAPSLARPIPPTGGMARAPEKQREEEAATEDSQAFAKYEPDALPNSILPLAALIVMAGFAIALTPRSRRSSGGRSPAPAYINRPDEPFDWRRPR